MRDIAAERGVAVGDARVGPRGDAVLVRDARRLVGRRAAEVEGADDVPRAPARVRPRGDVPRVHRLRGQRAARRGAAPARSAGSSPRHGGLCIGSGPGELYDQKKFDTPYIRDFLLDRGVLADVSETAAPWSALAPVYADVTAAARGAFARLGVPGYVMCHLSHSYHSGACLYFTFALAPSGRRDAARGVRRGQGGDPAGVRGLGRDALAPPRGRHGARALARAGHLGARRRDAARRCSTASTRAATSTRARSSDAAERLPPRTPRATMGRCTSMVHRAGRRRAGDPPRDAGARARREPRARSRKPAPRP